MIKPGIVVRDRYGNVGIVYERKPTPEQKWIDSLLDAAEVENLGSTDWWGVMLFGGGASMVPGPFLTYVRDATYDDFLSAADTAHASGRERLIRIFPNYVQQLLAEQRSKNVD